jgi:hypothetical protein
MSGRVLRGLDPTRRRRLALALQVLFGLLFFGAPWVTMDLLGIQPSAEAAALFRLYGIAILARALLRRGLSRATGPTVVCDRVVVDLGFSAATAAVLVFAILDGLAGSTTWAAVALFVSEACWSLYLLVGLRSTPGDGVVDERSAEA